MACARESEQKKRVLNYPFLLTLIMSRFLIDFVLLHVLKTKLVCFRVMTSKMDNTIEKLFKKKEFILIAPDGTKLVAYGFKEAKFLSFLVLEIYWRRIYETYLKEDRSTPMVIFDVGAHVGIFTLKTAKKIRNRGIVVAIEPNPHNYRRLQENIRLNGLDNIIVLNVALGEASDIVPLWLPPPTEENTGLASIRFKVGNHSIPVIVKTLAEVMKELNIDAINLLKLDSEGAELAILKGLGENLRKTQSLAIAAEHFSSEANEISEYVSSRGFGVRVELKGGQPYVYAEVLQEQLE
jgi:FkbM family methyltransferase